MRRGSPFSSVLSTTLTVGIAVLITGVVVAATSTPPRRSAHTATTTTTVPSAASSIGLYAFLNNAALTSVSTTPVTCSKG